MKKLLFLFTAILLISCSETISEHYNNYEPDYTKICVKNSSDLDSVKVYLTLQYPNSVIGMFGIKPSDTVSLSQGYFYAQKDSTYCLDHKATLFGWNISFLHTPVNCIDAIAAGYPTGINIVEGSINTEYEVFDISCVDGVNSLLKVSVTDTVYWTTGIGNYVKSFKSAENSTLGNNCNIRGVFPYRCNDCNRVNPKDAPPSCWKLADRCSSDSICQVARTGHAGGTILIEYKK